MASAAGTTSSAAPDVQQVPAAQHAGELAAAQRACDQAKADSAKLQNTVQCLQGGSASGASAIPAVFVCEQLAHCLQSQSAMSESCRSACDQYKWRCISNACCFLPMNTPICICAVHMKWWLRTRRPHLFVQVKTVICNQL